MYKSAGINAAAPVAQPPEKTIGATRSGTPSWNVLNTFRGKVRVLCGVCVPTCVKMQDSARCGPRCPAPSPSCCDIY